MMKNNIAWKGLVVGIILLFVGTSTIPAMAQKTDTQTVPSSTGNWWYVGGSGPGNYSKIQDAIDRASDGDTIFVFSGQYNEAINLNKQLFMKGIVIDGQQAPQIKAGNHHSTVTISNDSCSLENFTIRNYGTYACKGIYILSNNNIIKNCTLYTNSVSIHLSSSFNNLIYGNILEGGAIAMRLHSSCNNSIIKNDLYNQTNIGVVLFADKSCNNRFSNNNVYGMKTNWAIKIENSPFNIIEENYISQNYEGLIISSSKNTTVIRNSFFGNGILVSGTLEELCSYIIVDNLVDGKPLRYYFNEKGITVPADTGQIILVNCSNFIIKNFSFTGPERGIVLIFSSNNSITDNTISAGPAGIRLSNSHFNFISGNMIKGGRGGIILSSSNQNIISNNTLENQKRQPGISVSSSNNNKIIDNIFINCGTGISSQFGSENNEIIQNKITFSSRGISLYLSRKNYIFNNEVSNCSTVGINLKDSSRNCINNNIITNCKTGILVKNIQYTQFKRNNIFNNNIGIDITDGSFCILIKENNIFDNEIDNIFENYIRKVISIRWKNNYYGEIPSGPKRIKGTALIFSGYDAGRNLIPFPTYAPVPWIKFDWFPAQGPHVMSMV